MTLLLRDEADILALNLEHHLNQGIDYFIVTDNRSCDGTPQILKNYAHRGLLEIIEEPNETYAQAAWVTRMAERAATLGADWVLHADADEFWVARQPGQRVRDWIAQIPMDQPIHLVQRWNAALNRHHDSADWIDPVAVQYFDTKSTNSIHQPLPPKVLHRGQKGVQVAQGNHSVKWPHSEALVKNCDQLVILHFPYRGYRHYASKIRNGGRSYSANPDLPASVGSTWRSDYLYWLAGQLRRRCRQRLPSQIKFGMQRYSGRLQSAPNSIIEGISRGLPQAPARPWEAEEGVVCLADENYFFGVRLLYHSLQQQRPLTVYDLGLSRSSRCWVEAHPEIALRSIPETDLVQAIRVTCGEQTMTKPTKREWPLWICPLLIVDAPYRRVAWIDADAIVLRGIEKLFRLIEQKPFITRENYCLDQTINHPRLQQELPFATPGKGKQILLNAGVSGWCQERDHHLLEAYAHPIRCIFQGRSVSKDAVRWHDQGCLIWALQNAGYDASILRPRRWNLCIKHSPLKRLTIDRNSSDSDIHAWLQQARVIEQRANIVHWNGHPVPWI